MSYLGRTGEIAPMGEGLRDTILARTHRTVTVVAGKPVIVVLDPSGWAREFGNSDVMLKVDDRESLKLWVLNRTHVFLSKNNGGNWGHLRSNFEGVLAKRKMKRDRSGNTFYPFVLLKEGKDYLIHITGFPPPTDEVKERCDHFKINGSLQVEGPETGIMRPYPKNLPPHRRVFDWGAFQEGIYVLKLPTGSNKLNLPDKLIQLAYWQSVMFEISQDPLLVKFREKRAQGTLDDKDFEEKVKKLLEKKLGGVLGSVFMKEDMGSIDEDDYMRSWPTGRYPSLRINEESKHCFFFGTSRHVAKLQGSAETRDHIVLNKMTNTKTKPIAALSNFDLRRFDAKWIKNTQPEAIAKMMLKDDKEEADFLLMIAKNILGGKATEQAPFFHAAVGGTPERAMMAALNDASKRWQTLSQASSLDVAQKGGKERFLYSVKRVFFATGCDNLSNDVVPKHVYYQLQSWWDHLPLSTREVLEASIEVLVIGYASKAGSDADNQRLREDRAWKTAKSLELVMKDAYLQGESPKNKIPITWRPTSPSVFPDPGIFNAYQDIAFTEDVVDSSAVDAIQPRDVNDDRQSDRIALILFKREMPKEIPQMIEDINVTDTAMPIFEYKLLYHRGPVPGKSTKHLVIMYICPGEFADQGSKWNNPTFWDEEGPPEWVQTGSP